MQLVLSDRVAPNMPLPAEPVGDTRWPPLCLLIDYVSTEAAIVHLLNRGADINGPLLTSTARLPMKATALNCLVKYQMQPMN